MESGKNQALYKKTSIRIGGTPKHSIKFENESQLQEASSFLKSKGFPIVVLGGGSNTIFRDGDLSLSVLEVANKGIEVLKESQRSILLRVSAGENWDEVVSWAVSQTLSGIEAMSGIPGLVGATPIQNVGAYGQEISDVLKTLKAYSLKDDTWLEIDKEKCGFSYRNSDFKKGKMTDLVITSINIELSKKSPKVPDYPSIKDRFSDVDSVSLEDVRNIILDTRKRKLPDWKKEPNCGSFFENPIVKNQTRDEILADFPNMPYFDLADGKSKIYAGWLIEMVDMKGFNKGNLKTDPRNALVIVSNGRASFNELMSFKNEIASSVEDMFGITLEMEPRVY